MSLCWRVVSDIKKKLIDLQFEGPAAKETSAGGSGSQAMPGSSKYGVVKQKTDRRELKSEKKAEKAANLEHSIGLCSVAPQQAKP
eukprot:6419712-Amphidinium_carterae.1